MEKVLKFLTVDDQAMMIESSRRLFIAKGTEVLRQGDTTDRNLYTICSGVARMEVNGIAIGHIGPGALIGEMGFLDRSPASMSIIAHTELGVDVIEFEHLCTLFASVPGFATRFNASIAVLFSTRLRIAHQYLLKLRSGTRLRESRAGHLSSTSPTHAPGETECTELVIREVHGLCSEMAELSRSAARAEGSPDPALNAEVANACDRLHGLLTRTVAAQPERAASIGGYIFRQTFPYLMTSRTNDYAYAKPHGYDGDGDLLELIRADREAGYGAFGAAVDRWVLGRPITRALRARGAWIMEPLRGLVETWKGRTPVPVTCLMTGTAGDMVNLENFDRSLDVTCLEMDPKTLHDAAQRHGDIRGEVRISFVQTTMLALGRGGEHTFMHAQKAIIAPDILNRYDDDVDAIRMLDWVHAHLRPDGAVVMGQLRPDHEDRAYLEHILEWHYRYRDPRDIERLFAASRFKDDALTIEQHEDGIQMRVIGRRQGRA